MSQDNVEVVRRIWEAWERGDADTVFALYDPAIVWETHTDPIRGASPVDGLYHGHEGVRQFFREWRDSFGSWRAHAEAFIDARDKVVVGYRATGRGKASGAEVRGVFWLVYTLRNGLVVRIDLFGARADALEAVGLSEQDAHADS
jgi:uncharacterized protein